MKDLNGNILFHAKTQRVAQSCKGRFMDGHSPLRFTWRLCVKPFLKILSLLILTYNFTNAQDTSPIQWSRKVADKLIRDTRFELELQPQKPELGMQVIDFRHYSLKNKEVAYACNKLNINGDSVIHFGITSAGRIKIWVNKKLVFEQNQRTVNFPKEIAYGRFVFDNNFSAQLKKGTNEILIKYESGSAAPVIFLRPVLENKDLNTAVLVNNGGLIPGWLVMAPFFDFSVSYPCEKEFASYYNYGGKIYNWQSAPQKYIAELVIDSTITYQRDAYADWNYSNGLTVWSLTAFEEEKYTSFVKKYADFILQHNDYFKWQYDSLFAYRGAYHRIYRKSMLDDSGTPALPFAELYLKEKNSSIKAFLDPIEKYVFKEQVRLQDGIFCRPEPVEFAVWADDLFMSVPFMLRMARATGKQEYYNDAAAQVILFKKYLLDNNTGLYKHGWFSTTGQQSVAFWGRANGWVVWATAELLQWLPKNHPQYKTILKQFQLHIASLAKCQERTGMWHQLLNRTDSYEETSCTALFTLAIARGVRMGWLNSSYKQNAIDGWNAVKRKIEEDGTVHGICRGTEIGFDEKFYMERKTFDQDPRGLGAVITAGIEMSKLK